MSLPRLVESDAFFGAVEVFRPDDTRSETLWGSELNADGMYLQTNRPYAPGQKLGLAFHLMGERVVIRAAEVVSVKPFEPVNVDGRMPGMTVRFVAMDPPYRGALRRHAAPARLSLVPTAAPDDLDSLCPDPYLDTTGPVPTPPPLERPRHHPATEHLAAFEEGPLTPLSLPPVAPLDDATAVDLQRPVFTTEEERELREAMAEHDAADPTDEEVYAMADPTETLDRGAPRAPMYASKTPGQVDTGAPEHPLAGWTFHPVAPLSPSLLHEPDTLDTPLETSDPWRIGAQPLEPLLERPAAPADAMPAPTPPPAGVAFEPGDISGVFLNDDSVPGFTETALADGAFDASLPDDIEGVFGDERGDLDLSFSDAPDGDDAYDDTDDIDDEELEAFAHEAPSDTYDGGIDVLSAASVMRRADVRRTSANKQRVLGVLVAVAGASLGVVLGLQTGPANDEEAPAADAIASAAETTETETETEVPAVKSVADLERSLRPSTATTAAKATITARTNPRPDKPAAPKVATERAPAPAVAAAIPPPKRSAATTSSPTKRKLASRSARRAAALSTPVFSAGSADVALRGGEIVRAFGLAGPGRVVVDLKGVDYPGFIRQDVHLDGIAAFRVGRPDKEHVRVVIELERDAKPSGIRAEKGTDGLRVTWR